MKKYYEDEESDHPRLKLLIVGFVAVSVILAAIAVAYAVYVMNSPPVSGTVGAQATLGLALNPTTIIQGEQWTLTATVSDATSGITVTFVEGATTVGTAVTDVSGVATLTLTPSVGFHMYSATATHP